MVDYLAEYFTLRWPSWSVKTLNELLQALLSFKASDKKWAAILTDFLLYVSWVFLSLSLQYTFSTAKHTPRRVCYLFFESEHRKILLTWAHLGIDPSCMDMPEYDLMCFLRLRRVQPWKWPMFSLLVEGNKAFSTPLCLHCSYLHWVTVVFELHHGEGHWCTEDPEW